MNETESLTVPMILLRLLIAGVIGGLIGYERRMYHKSIGIAGMILVAVGSAGYMLLAKHLSGSDPASLSRALQGMLQGIGFLGGAVIFKGGTDVRGIKTAAAIWITGAIGMAIATWFWWLGVLMGLITAAILFVADRFPGARQQTEEELEQAEAHAEKAELRAHHAERQALRTERAADNLTRK
ncbi:MAG: MgtC/SapB family protein [Roseiflexaceae bacterium]